MTFFKARIGFQKIGGVDLETPMGTPLHMLLKLSYRGLLRSLIYRMPT